MLPCHGGPTMEATLICQQSSSHLLAQPPYMISLLSCCIVTSSSNVGSHAQYTDHTRHAVASHTVRSVLRIVAHGRVFSPEAMTHWD